MSSTKDTDSDTSPRADYQVGYRRPPVATRFQPGNCCNPKGRPKRKQTAGDLISEALNSKVRISVDGKAKVMTKQQVIIHSLVNAAARGDLKAIQAVLALRERYQDTSDATIDPADLGFDDRKILDDFLAKALTANAVVEPERDAAGSSSSQRSTSDELADPEHENPN